MDGNPIIEGEKEVSSFSTVVQYEDANEESVVEDQEEFTSQQFTKNSSETENEENIITEEFSSTDESSNLSNNNIEEQLEVPESFTNETSTVESANISNSNLEVDSGTLDDLTLEPSSTDIDAENYSIHSFSGESTKLNGTETTETNSFSFSNVSAENESDTDEINPVETTPLIPEWANQTENPAFFQNLDIPTFLRRRGSNRPRQ